MCKLFEEWSDEIRDYCHKNNLDFNKAQKLSKCWGEDFVALQYHDPEKGEDGLIDDTPMPLVLLISKTLNGLVFEQTEFTRRYLS